MASVFSVSAKISADTAAFTAGLKKAEERIDALEKASGTAGKGVGTNLDGMGKKASGLSGILGKVSGALVALGAVNFVSGAISQASSLEAEFEGVNQTFGESAKVVQDFAKQAAFSAGMSNVAALKAAKNIGAYGKAVGLTGEENAKFSTSLLQAAGDLGSFYDVSTDDALSAIQMGLRGESEGLRKFGILLDENVIKQQAMKDGLIETTSQALTPQQKTLATYSAIMGKIGVAQGDFVKYNDTYGNSIKTVGALFQNLQADVGGALLPAMAQLASALVPVIQQLGPVLTTVMQSLAPLITAITSNLGALIPVLQPIFNVVGMVAGVFAELINTVLPPILAILPPIMALFESLIAPIMTLVQALLPPLSQILQIVANTFLALMPSIMAILPSLTSLITLVGTLLAEALTTVMPYFQQFMDVFALLVEALMPILPPILNLVEQLLPLMIMGFQLLLPPILQIATVIAQILLPVIKAIAETVGPVFQVIGDIIGFVVGKIGEFIDWLMPYVTPILNAIIDGVNAVFGMLGIPPIPKLSAPVKKSAYDEGKALGEAKADGYAAGTAGVPGLDVSKVKTTNTSDTTTTANKPGGGGGAKKNPVTEYYKKINAEIKKQNAKTKLLSMGLSETIADSVVSSGEGWDKIYKKLVKGGTKAMDALEAKYAQTGEAMKAMTDTVGSEMSKVRDSMTAGFDITKMGKSSSAIVANGRKLVAKAKAFGEEIKKLAASGLNPTLLNQIISAGPDAGMATAKALNQGGISSVDELNSLYQQANDIGNDVGASMVQSQANYYITVSGGVGDKNTIGKAIVESIKAYERSSGTNWRS